LRVCRAIVVAAGLGAALAGCVARFPPREPGTPVSAAALPHPKPGLWSWSSQAGGAKRLCLSGQLLSALAARPDCPVTRQIRTDAGAYVVEASCRTGQVGRTWAKSSGDYARAFTVDIVIEDARGDVADHANYRYLGPCAPGQHPDDAP
jgi:hypothetical protein